MTNWNHVAQMAAGVVLVTGGMNLALMNNMAGDGLVAIGLSLLGYRAYKGSNI